MIGLHTLGACHPLKIDFVSGFEHSVSFTLNRGIMNKNFFTVLRFDEAVAFLR
jgi:hypothetical protein